MGQYVGVPDPLLSLTTGHNLWNGLLQLLISSCWHSGCCACRPSELWVSWLAALLRYRGDDSICKLVLFSCEAACSTRALYPPCLHSSCSIQHLWAEETLSELQVGILYQAWGSSSWPMLFTLTCFLLSWNSAYALKWSSCSDMRDALHLMLSLFFAGSVMDKKRFRRLSAISTEKKGTVWLGNLLWCFDQWL